jgi:hypothetical protein
MVSRTITPEGRSMTATLEQEPEVTANESERLAARRRQKIHVAELQLSHKRLEELRADVRGLDAHADAAAAEHQIATSEIQAELAAAEEAIVAALADQKPVPTELEATRTNCIARLREANEKLATSIAAIEKLRLQNQSDQNALAGDTSRLLVAQWELAKPPLASPELLLKRQVLESKKPWLDRWAAHTYERVEKIERDLQAKKTQGERLAREFAGGSRNLRVSKESQAYLDQARRIASAAGTEASDCVARLASLHQEMIDE